MPVYVDGPYGGTPMDTNGFGRFISIWGEGDNEGFEDYAAVDDPRHVVGDIIHVPHPVMSELPDESVSHFSIRDSPFDLQEWREIIRTARPGAMVTVSGPTETINDYYDQIRNGDIFEAGVVSRPITIKLPVRERETGTGKIIGWASGCAITFRFNEDPALAKPQ